MEVIERDSKALVSEVHSPLGDYARRRHVHRKFVFRAQAGRFVLTSHPLRSIRVMANEALAKMHRVFAGLYEADIKGGRPGVAPEKLLRAMLLQVLYSIRSERQLMEQTHYNLLFRWFIGLSMGDSVWVPTVFTKNRERLIRHDAVVEFFNEVLSIAQERNWLSGEHFSVGGTLIQVWAGHKSFVRKDGDDSDNDGNSGEGGFKGSKRSKGRTSPGPTPMHGFTAKARRQANCVTWDTR